MVLFWLYGDDPRHEIGDVMKIIMFYEIMDLELGIKSRRLGWQDWLS